MIKARVEIPKERIAELCRRHHIRKLSLFGSVLRDDFGPDSDIDVLVEFEPGHVPGYRLVTIQDELSELLGDYPVDLVIAKSVIPPLRARILAQAQVQYAAE